MELALIIRTENRFSPYHRNDGFYNQKVFGLKHQKFRAQVTVSVPFSLSLSCGLESLPQLEQTKCRLNLSFMLALLSQSRLASCQPSYLELPA
jgi:hypothetical protein